MLAWTRENATHTMFDSTRPSPAPNLRLFSQVRGGAASGNRTPDLLITRPYPAYYGVYQRQQLQLSHL